MTENAQRLGEIFRTAISDLQSPIISTVRGKGLLNAIVIDESKLSNGATAWDLCLLMKRKGLLAKPTHQNIIRLAPPLCITESEMKECIKIISSALKEIQTWDKQKDPLE